MPDTGDAMGNETDKTAALRRWGPWGLVVLASSVWTLGSYLKSGNNNSTFS